MAIIQMKFFSTALKTKTNVNVLIPTVMPESSMGTKPGQDFEGFYSGHGNYPVLYLLHGSFGDEGDWVHNSRIEDYASNRNLVVVMPYGENSFFLDTKSGKNYETYITEELPAIIQYMFPVSKKREDTFIAGLSMGRNAAVRIGLSYPELYSNVVGLSFSVRRSLRREKESNFTVWRFAFEGKDLDSEALDIGALAKRLVSTGAPRPRIYISVGEDDYLFSETESFHKILDGLGIEHSYSTTPGAIHNWDFWDPEIRKVLDWLPITTV